MKPYNGFTGAERSKAWEIQKKAMAAGLITCTSCEMCGQDKGVLMPHLENYDEPIKEYHSLCVECHMNLHGRFSSNGGWLSYLLKLRAGYVSIPFYVVGDYFQSEANKQFYWAKNKKVHFVPRKNVWFENLSLTQINYRELYGTTKPAAPISKQLEIQDI